MKGRTPPNENTISYSLTADVDSLINDVVTYHLNIAENNATSKVTVFNKMLVLLNDDQVIDYLNRRQAKKDLFYQTVVNIVFNIISENIEEPNNNQVILRQLLTAPGIKDYLKENIKLRNTICLISDLIKKNKATHSNTNNNSSNSSKKKPARPNNASALLDIKSTKLGLQSKQATKNALHAFLPKTTIAKNKYIAWTDNDFPAIEKEFNLCQQRLKEYTDIFLINNVKNETISELNRSLISMSNKNKLIIAAYQQWKNLSEKSENDKKTETDHAADHLINLISRCQRQISHSKHCMLVVDNLYLLIENHNVDKNEKDKFINAINKLFMKMHEFNLTYSKYKAAKQTKKMFSVPIPDQYYSQNSRPLDYLIDQLSKRYNIYLGKKDRVLLALRGVTSEKANCAENLTLLFSLYNHEIIPFSAHLQSCLYHHLDEHNLLQEYKLYQTNHDVALSEPLKEALATMISLDHQQVYFQLIDRIKLLKKECDDYLDEARDANKSGQINIQIPDNITAIDEGKIEATKAIIKQHLNNVYLKNEYSKIKHNKVKLAMFVKMKLNKLIFNSNKLINEANLKPAPLVKSNSLTGITSGFMKQTCNKKSHSDPLLVIQANENTMEDAAKHLTNSIDSSENNKQMQPTKTTETIAKKMLEDHAQSLPIHHHISAPLANAKPFDLMLKELIPLFNQYAARKDKALLSIVPMERGWIKPAPSSIKKAQADIEIMSKRFNLLEQKFKMLMSRVEGYIRENNIKIMTNRKGQAIDGTEYDKLSVILSNPREYFICLFDFLQMPKECDQLAQRIAKISLAATQSTAEWTSAQPKPSTIN